nr:MAG TPA: YadA-like membrane anchor domain protein [Bacteriophage sp.]
MKNTIKKTLVLSMVVGSFAGVVGATDTVETLRKDVDENRNMIATTWQETQKVAKKTRENENYALSLGVDIINRHKEINKNIKTVETSVTDTNGKVDVNTTKINSLATDLDSTNSRVDSLQSQVDALQSPDFTNVKEDIKKVGALAAALSGLHTIQYDEGTPWQMQASVGTYKGKAAVALGGSYFSDANNMFHFGVAMNTGGGSEVMANISYTHRFGTTTGKKKVENERVKALEAENNNLRERLAIVEHKLGL